MPLDSAAVIPASFFRELTYKSNPPIIYLANRQRQTGGLADGVTGTLADWQTDIR
jgi:hypothetical protein